MIPGGSIDFWQGPLELKCPNEDLELSMYSPKVENGLVPEREML